MIVIKKAVSFLAGCTGGFIKKFEQDRKKISLVILVSLIIFLFDLFVILGLQLKNLKSMLPKIQKISKDINELNKDLLFYEKLKKQQETLDQKEVSSVKTIVSEQQFPRLFQDVCSVANNYNIKILQAKPNMEVKKKESGRKQEKKQEQKKEEKLSPVFIEMALLCDYHSLGRFINDLEGGKQFIAVQQIRIGRDSEDYLMQNANLILKTYVKK